MSSGWCVVKHFALQAPAIVQVQAIEGDIT
jgi:hypothetical protein